jgi:hypothetical protein
VITTRRDEMQVIRTVVPMESLRHLPRVGFPDSDFSEGLPVGL